jgi:transcriptional regulator
MNTADIIKKRREELGLSQEELAAKLGYKSRSSINKIELGLSDIPFSKIPLFAKALELEPEILMGWGKEKVNEKLEEVLKSHNKYPKTELKGEFTITENINDEYIRILNVENEKANEMIYNLKRNEYDSKMIDKIKISFSLNDINYTDADVYKFIKLFKEYKKLSDDKQKEIEDIIYEEEKSDIYSNYIKAYELFGKTKDKKILSMNFYGSPAMFNNVIFSKSFNTSNIIKDDFNFYSYFGEIKPKSKSMKDIQTYIVCLPEYEGSDTENFLKENLPEATVEKVPDNNLSLHSD